MWTFWAVFPSKNSTKSNFWKLCQNIVHKLVGLLANPQNNSFNTSSVVRTSSNEQCIPGQCHSTNNKIMVKTKNLRYRGQGQHWSWWCDIPVTEFANYSFRSRILWPRYPKLLTLVTKAEAENLRDQVQGQCYSTISKAKVKTLWY